MKSGTTKMKMSGNVEDVTHSQKDWKDFWYNEDK